VRRVCMLVATVSVGWTLALSESASAATHCHHVRGYYDVRVKHVSCARAGHILWRARQGGGDSQTIEGWTCDAHAHGAGGGFPVEMVCTKRRAWARGWVFDGPA
jgi:hypothetical protein